MTDMIERVATAICASDFAGHARRPYSLTILTVAFPFCLHDPQTRAASMRANLGFS